MTTATSILTHSGIPLLDNKHDSREVALAINTKTTVVANSGKQGVQPYVSITPRDRIVSIYAATTTDGNTTRTTDCPELVGQWDNLLPGISATVVLQGSTSLASTVEVLVVVTNENTNQQYMFRLNGQETGISKTLRDCYTKAIVFIENAHFFLLIQDFCFPGNHVLIDLWLFKGRAITATQLDLQDAPYTRVVGNVVFFPRLNNQTSIHNETSTASITRFHNPSLATVDERSGYVSNITPAIANITPNEDVLVLGANFTRLSSAFYYSTRSRTDLYNLPIGATTIQMSPEMSQLYHLRESDNPGFIYNSTSINNDSRLGNAVVNLGASASAVCTGVSNIMATETPITATNNAGVGGTNFIQYIQPKASAFATRVNRARLMPPITSTKSVLMYSQSGTPHLRSGVSFTSPFSDSYVTAPKSRDVLGIISETTSGVACTLRGDYHVHLQVDLQQANTLAGYNCPWVPFATLGRTFVSSSFHRTPMFGLLQTEVRSFYDIGNGRLAAVTNNNEIYISSPVRTIDEYPSFLDFQIRTFGVAGQNAEVYKITARNITSIIAFQAGYIVTSDDGVFTINNITGIISKVNDSNALAVANTGGLYLVLNVGRTYDVYQYDDNIKQLAQIFAGTINESLAAAIGTNSDVINTNIYSYYLSRRHTVLARNESWIVYLDEHNILHKDVYNTAKASFCGRLITWNYGNNISAYNTFNPVLGRIGDNVNLWLDQVAGSNITIAPVFTPSALTDAYRANYDDYGAINVNTLNAASLFNNSFVGTQRPFYGSVITTFGDFLPPLETGEHVEYNQYKLEYEFLNTSLEQDQMLTMVQGYYRQRNARVNNTEWNYQNYSGALGRTLTQVTRVTFARCCYILKLRGVSIQWVRSYTMPQKVMKR
jgi:hypothetical protein